MNGTKQISDAATLKEVIVKFNELRAKWVAEFGNDAGFDEWFSAQLKRQ